MHGSLRRRDQCPGGVCTTAERGSSRFRANVLGGHGGGRYFSCKRLLPSKNISACAVSSLLNPRGLVPGAFSAAMVLFQPFELI